MTDLATSPRATPPVSPRFLADVYEAASRCNKCSLCQAVCPTYVVNPVEWESARGRVSLVRDAIEGRIDLKEIADGPLSTCLGCNNCMDACAPGVPTADIVFRARQELSDETGLSLGRRIALRGVFPNPGMLRFVHLLSRAAQVTGLHAVARRSGLTNWMGGAGATMEHVGPVARKTAYKRVASLPAVAQPVRGRVGFLVCCYQNSAAPEATESTMRVLLANGFEVTAPTLGCSGLPARSLGDRESELDMAARNTRRLDAVDVDVFVGDVAACTDQYRRYCDLLDGTADASSARTVATRTWLSSEFLAKVGMTAELGPLRWRVAIDEPCSLPKNAAARTAANTLLSAIPRIEIVPLNEAEMCCGGPGMYFAQQPERSEEILKRKFENVIASDCEVLVTENISCITQLRDGARRYAPSVRVMHVFEVLDQALTAAAQRGGRL